MSYEDGWAAIHLEMPRRIPRTEYSAEMHWDLIRAVTKIPVDLESASEVKLAASTEFMRRWNYDLFWSTLVGEEVFGEFRTDMGHGEYAAGGVDRRDSIFCPFKDPEEVLGFDFVDKLGKVEPAQMIKRFEAHYQENEQRHPFGVNMTGIYVTLISGFIGLFGWEMLLLAAGTDLRRFGRLADRYAEWMLPYFEALAEADVPLVMVHDDIVWSAGAIFRPAWYREFIFPNYKRYFAPLLDSGKKILFCSDGNFTEFLEDIAGTGVHGFVFEPLTSLEAVVELYGKTHVIIGNVETRVLLTGGREQIRAEVKRCLDLGRACPGYFLAAGNHIPPNTPVENALYYNQVYEELCWRRP